MLGINILLCSMFKCWHIFSLNRAWKFQDICYAANFPVVEDDFLDRVSLSLKKYVISLVVQAYTLT